MPPPVELGRRAHVPVSGIIDLVDMAALMWFFRGFLVFLRGLVLLVLDFIHIPTYTRWKQKSSHLIHVSHVMAMCRTAHVGFTHR